MAERLGATKAHSVKAYQWTLFGLTLWIGSSGLFAAIGLFQKVWAIILSAILVIIFFGFFFFVGVFVIDIKPTTPRARLIGVLVFLATPVVSNFLAIIYSFKDRRGKIVHDI